MLNSSTGLISGLKLIYRHYGGWKDLLRSEYAYLSAIATIACWRLAVDGTWVDFAKSAMPTLAGFSVASYAVFFAVLNEKSREALRVPEPKLGDKSPLLVLTSSVSHAVVIQVVSLLLSLIYASSPLELKSVDILYFYIFSYPASFFGLFMTIYGSVLILGPMISIFRIMDIQSRLPHKNLNL